MFGDNQSVITSSTIPNSFLNKYHNALVYHQAGGAIAADMMWFFHINGTGNQLDVLTKFLGHCVFWSLINLFLFWHGGPTLIFLLLQVKPILYRGRECQLEQYFLIIMVVVYSNEHLSFITY
jgi:hypothetical protein